MTQAFLHLLLALSVALLAGCSAPSDTGSAQLAVLLPHADASSISRVSVTASAADLPSVSVDLAPAAGVRSGHLGNLPAGPQRTFRAQAFDASGTELFQGSASGVPISAGRSAFIAITLQEPGAAAASNEPPVIDSLVASSTSVVAGGALSLTVTAHGLHPDEPLSYAWSSTSGTFSPASEAATTWTASDATGTQTLTVTVTDSGGLSTSASLDVTVLSSGEQGAAQVTVSFNNAPRVDAFRATPAQLTVGQATAVSASASDLDGDSLSYAWSASCAGTWDDASSGSARFTPSALPSGSCNNCELTVAVSDARGGHATGTLALCVGTTPAASHHFPPHILRSYRSSAPWEPIAPAQVLTYEVAASDPEGSALSFSWAANAGALGAPASTASQSRATWTAPACVREGTTPAITATVTNAFSLTATSRFEVMGLPICRVSEWATTGAMAAARRDHTATLLLNEQVLVAGGQNTTALATAELYSPASGTWSATGTMRSARYLHTATRLQGGTVLVAGGYNSGSGYLSAAELYNPTNGTWSATGALRAPRYLQTATLLGDGKVLVAGGFNSASAYLGTAEVYNPATGTWSLTGAMASARGYHTATRLPNGKVLVAGGRASGFLATAELYDPASGTWSTTGSMASPRASHTAVLLNDGKVLVSGGTHQSTTLGTAELYDPATGTWSTTGSLASPRSSAAAVVLASGQVLVAGGRGSNSLGTAEVYHPASGTWSAAGAMSTPRANHTATLLPNGKLLVSGGVRGSTVLSTADLHTH